jgi:hypothetical protein
VNKKLKQIKMIQGNCQGMDVMQIILSMPLLMCNCSCRNSVSVAAGPGPGRSAGGGPALYGPGRWTAAAVRAARLLQPRLWLASLPVSGRRAWTAAPTHDAGSIFPVRHYRSIMLFKSTPGRRHPGLRSRVTVTVGPLR